MIFISHAWVDGKPDERVLQLVASLRVLGYDARCDDMVISERTSANFLRMISDNMKKAEKIIVMLSRKYKEKAEEFLGGVGIEYQYIIGDIDNSPHKYILATFDTIEDIKDILPDFLRDREVIFMSNYGLRKLLYRLNDIPEYKYPDVGHDKVQLQPQNINILPEISELLNISSVSNARKNEWYPIIKLSRRKKDRGFGGHFFYLGHNHDSSKCCVDLWFTLKNVSDCAISKVEIIDFSFRDLTLENLINSTDDELKIQCGLMLKNDVHSVIFCVEIEGDKNVFKNKAELEYYKCGYIKIFIQSPDKISVIETIHFEYVGNDDIIDINYDFE